MSLSLEAQAAAFGDSHGILFQYWHGEHAVYCSSVGEQAVLFQLPNQEIVRDLPTQLLSR